MSGVRIAKDGSLFQKTSLFAQYVEVVMRQRRWKSLHEFKNSTKPLGLDNLPRIHQFGSGIAKLSPSHHDSNARFFALGQAKIVLT